MNIFNLKSEILPDVNEYSTFYSNYIDKWKQLYQAERQTVQFTNADGNKRSRDKKSLRLPKVISEYFATLVFSEKVQITVDNEQVNEYVQQVLKSNDFMTKQQELLEFMFALGGSVNKVYRNNNKTIIDYVIADAFIPTEYSNEQIYGGVFLSYKAQGEHIYTLVEQHKFKDNTIMIKHNLFRQNKNNATEQEGIEVPLATIYPDLQPVVIIENVTKPIFTYCKPSIANNIELDSPLGISVFENARDTIDMLDTCFDGFDREFKLGKKKIIVPAYAIKTQTLTDGKVVRYYDPDEDVYAPLNIDDTTNFNFKDDTQTLRIDEHVNAINALLNVLCLQIGLSNGSISFDAKTGLKTATEVISENSKTYRTKEKHEVNIEKSLKEIVNAIIEVGIASNELKAISDHEIIIKFDDSIIIDNETEEQKDLQKVTMGLMSKLRYLVKWEGLSEEDAQKELAEINKGIEGVPESE